MSERLSDAVLKHLYDLAQAFVDLDFELRARLEVNAKEYAEAAGKRLPAEAAYILLEEGAVIFKHNELIRKYKEAREAAEV